MFLKMPVAGTIFRHAMNFLLLFRARGTLVQIINVPVRTEDFYNFDLIIGMDDRNIDDKIKCRQSLSQTPFPGQLLSEDATSLLRL